MQIIGEKKAQKRKRNSDGNHYDDSIQSIIRNIREKLEKSPMIIFQFIEACTRKLFKSCFTL